MCNASTTAKNVDYAARSGVMRRRRTRYRYDCEVRTTTTTPPAVSEDL